MMYAEGLGEHTRLVHGTPSYEAYNGKVRFSYLFICICPVHVHVTTSHTLQSLSTTCKFCSEKRHHIQISEVLERKMSHCQISGFH